MEHYGVVRRTLSYQTVSVYLDHRAAWPLKMSVFWEHIKVASLVDSHASSSTNKVAFATAN